MSSCGWPQDYRKNEKVCQWEGHLFLSHLPNIGKTIEHGAMRIELSVLTMEMSVHIDNQPFIIKVIYKQQGQKQ